MQPLLFFSRLILSSLGCSDLVYSIPVEYGELQYKGTSTALPLISVERTTHTPPMSTV